MEEVELCREEVWCEALLEGCGEELEEEEELEAEERMKSSERSTTTNTSRAGDRDMAPGVSMR